MEEVDRLIAERAVERLIVRYAQLVDFGQAAEIADLFTEDGEWEGVDLLLEGRERIREWFVKREGLARRVSRHVYTNIAVDVTSATEASSVSYMINYRHDRAEGDDRMPVPIEVPKYLGECHDRFRLTDEGWRFTRRRVDVAFVRDRRVRPPIQG